MPTSTPPVSDIVVPRSFEDQNVHPTQKNTVQFPSPPDQAPSYPRPSAPLPSSAVLIDKYLSAYSNQAGVKVPLATTRTGQNTIEFPLASAPAKRKAETLFTDVRPQAEPVRAMHRWMVRTYELDEKSVVPEMDVRVKYKSLWDRLERNGSTYQASEPIELVKDVFPGVIQETRVLEGSIRSNEEHVLRGIRFRKNPHLESLCMCPPPSFFYFIFLRAWFLCIHPSSGLL